MTMADKCKIDEVTDSCSEGSRGGAKCPVCGVVLDLVPATTDWSQPFPTRSSFDKIRRACGDHAKQFHEGESIWNMIGKMDLTTMNSSHKRMKNRRASVMGLVSYSLNFAGRRLRLHRKINLGVKDIKALILFRLGYAVRVAEEAKTYFSGRVEFVDADQAVEISSEVKLLIKKKASDHIKDIMERVMLAEPYNGWASEPWSRRLNKLQLFFLEEGSYATLRIFDTKLEPYVEYNTHPCG